MTEKDPTPPPRRPREYPFDMYRIPGGEPPAIPTPEEVRALSRNEPGIRCRTEQTNRSPNGPNYRPSNAAHVANCTYCAQLTAARRGHN